MRNLRIRKRLKLYWLLNKIRIRDWIIFFAIMTCVFLPVRLVFWTYVSHSWGSNIGIMSMIAVVMFFLVINNKLGSFGRLYNRQMIKIAANKKIGLEIVGGMILTIGFNSAALYLYDYSEQHLDEINHINAIVNPYDMLKVNLQGYSLDMFSSTENDRIYVKLVQPDMNNIWLINHLRHNYVFIIAWIIHVMNFDVTHAWGTHFSAVFLIEELEGIGLWFFYRKVYIKKLGDSWNNLNLFNSQIKQFIKIDKKRQSLIYAITHKA